MADVKGYSGGIKDLLLFETGIQGCRLCYIEGGRVLSVLFFKGFVIFFSSLYWQTS